jgi:opacity protein-like surface antigen
MKKLLLAAVLACAPSAVLAADMTGAWTINGAFDAMGVKYTVTCNLTQDGTGKLAGPCKGPMGEPLTAAGAVTGASVELAYDTTYQGAPVHLDYKGDVQSDGTLKGTIDTGGPQGTFTATKQ